MCDSLLIHGLLLLFIALFNELVHLFQKVFEVFLLGVLISSFGNGLFFRLGVSSVFHGLLSRFLYGHFNWLLNRLLNGLFNGLFGRLLLGFSAFNEVDGFLSLSGLVLGGLDGLVEVALLPGEVLSGPLGLQALTLEFGLESLTLALPLLNLGLHGTDLGFRCRLFTLGFLSPLVVVPDLGVSLGSLGGRIGLCLAQALRLSFKLLGNLNFIFLLIIVFIDLDTSILLFLGLSWLLGWFLRLEVVILKVVFVAWFPPAGLIF